MLCNNPSVQHRLNFSSQIYECTETEHTYIATNIYFVQHNDITNEDNKKVFMKDTDLDGTGTVMSEVEDRS